MSGEAVWAHGYLPTDARRPVVLQRRDGDSWRRVDQRLSFRYGRFAFLRHAPVKVGASVVFRVKAPAVRTGGHHLATVVTPSARVTVVEQTASLSSDRTEIFSGEGEFSN